MKNTLTEKAMPVSLARELINSAYPIHFKRFHSCNAYYSDPVSIGEYTVRFLKSYSTIVGVVFYDEDTVTEFGKYSVTTSKQFTQMYNELFSHYGFSREFNPYRI